MDLTDRGGDDYVVGMDGECSHLADTVYNTVSSEASLAPGLVGRGWSGVFGNFLLNLLTIFANAVTYFRQKWL